MSESGANPMRRWNLSAAREAPRCGAKSKRTGKQCRGPAVRGKSVCRMHGATGGAPTGEKNGAWRHGGRTLTVQRDLRRVADLLSQWRNLRSGILKSEG